MKLENYLPGIPDFPKPGILFRDIGPLLANADAFAYAVDSLGKLSKAYSFEYVLGIESRGFIFASALANHLHKGLVIVRKPNKLPPKTHQESYGLEYGNDRLEISQQILNHQGSVLIVDDVLATGGTIAAATRLVQKTGAHVVAALCLLEIHGLDGAKNLARQSIESRCLLKL
jgi:adenine phosphoribosyltransferase